MDYLRKKRNSKKYLQMKLVHCLERDLNIQQKKIKLFIGNKLFEILIWRSFTLDCIKCCNCDTIKLHQPTIK